jgi:hypothetical protein
MYLVTSAEGLKEEPKEYGPLRLLEVLERIALYAAKSYDDAFLREIAGEVSENKDLVMTDNERFYRALENLVVRFASEARDRNKRKENKDA